jgi:hypothetical protein
MKIIPNQDLPEPEMYYLYVYNKDGFHNGKIEVLPDDLDHTFLTTIRQAQISGVKVTMTDEWDNCVFHMENGQVIFPKPQHISDADLDSLIN